MNGSCARISPKAVPSPRCSSRANTCSAMQLTDALREAVIATAREAAAEILRVYDTCFDVDHKADDRQLTAAELAAHRCNVDRLEQRDPDNSGPAEIGRAASRESVCKDLKIQRVAAI